MKITKNTLKRMIKEELSKVLREEETSSDRHFADELQQNQSNSKANLPIAEKNIQKVKYMLEDAGFEIVESGEVKVDKSSPNSLYDPNRGSLIMPNMTASKNGKNYSIKAREFSNPNSIYTIKTPDTEMGQYAFEFNINPKSLQQVNSKLDKWKSEGR